MTDWADDLTDQIATDFALAEKPPSQARRELVAARLRHLFYNGIMEGIEQTLVALNLPPADDSSSVPTAPDNEQPYKEKE